jgi:hypothetical protein
MSCKAVLCEAVENRKGCNVDQESPLIYLTLSVDS